MDNTIVEQIADPLLHLIQNAVVHSIEPAAERLARGKPREGRIALTAYQRGGAVFVEVEDDGRGIDVAAVREQAVRRGLLVPEVAARLGEREALSLLFLSASAPRRPSPTPRGAESASTSCAPILRASMGRSRWRPRRAPEPGSGCECRSRSPSPTRCWSGRAGRRSPCR